MKALTAKQQEIFGFIRSYITNNGFPPSRQDISSHFGFKSPNSAETHLRALERAGRITVHSGIARGITVLCMTPA